MGESFSDCCRHPDRGGVTSQANSDAIIFPVRVRSAIRWARFVTTALGLRNAAIAEHGSGKALAVHLGNTSSNPARWISDHRRRIKKALES